MSNINVVKDTIERIICDDIDLPSPPQVMLRIEEALKSDKHDVDYLMKLILFDPALSARLIKLASSPLYGSRGKITSVREAILRVGLKATKNVTLLLLAQNSFHASNPVIARYMDTLWEQSVDVAAISAAIAKRTSTFSIDRAMLAGLLQDIGSMLLLTRLDSVLKNLKFPKTLEVICANQGPKLGAMLMRHWGLDRDLIDVVESKDDWYRENAGEPDLSDLVLVARLHSLAASGAASQYPGICDIPAYERLAAKDASAGDSLAILGEAQDEIDQIKLLLKAG